MTLDSPLPLSGPQVLTVSDTGTPKFTSDVSIPHIPGYDSWKSLDFGDCLRVRHW